jgi:hypothetical protein
MWVSLYFLLNENIKDVHTYLKLRLQGRGSAGYYPKQTKNNRRDEARIEKKGWVVGGRVVSMNKIASEYESKKIVFIPEDVILDIKLLKGFKIASAESYVINSKLLAQTIGIVDHRDKSRNRYYWGDQDKVDVISGVKKSTVSVSLVRELTGLSNKTISNHRKNSPNLYRYKKNYHDSIYEVKEGTPYYFSSKKKKYVTIESTVVLTNIVIKNNLISIKKDNNSIDEGRGVYPQFNTSKN